MSDTAQVGLESEGVCAPAADAVGLEVRALRFEGLPHAVQAEQLGHPEPRGLHSLTSELNLRTFGTHPRVNLGYMGDRVSSS